MIPQPSKTLRRVCGSPAHPVLEQMFRSRALVSIIVGPFGSGKTVLVLERMLWQAAEQAPNARGIRPTRWLVIRNTYRDLMGTSVRDLQAVFGELGQMRYGGQEAPEFVVDIPLADRTRIHAVFVFLALDRPDAIRKLRGYQVTGVWLNEVKELQKTIVDVANDRHGRYPSLIDGGVLPTWHGMLGDCNAPDEDHWLYKLAEEERPPGWAFFKQPGGVMRDESGAWVANPAAENIENLPGHYDYYLSKIPALDDEYVGVMYANQYGFTIEGKPFHTGYDDSKHCADVLLRPNPAWPLVLGVDFGRTPAATIWQRNPALVRWYGLDELCGENMSVAVFGPQLKLYLESEYSGFQATAWCDPAGVNKGQEVEQSAIEILRAAGIPARPAPSNALELRRAAIDNPIRRTCPGIKGVRDRALLISPKMKLFRKGLMGGYGYRRLKLANVERYTDEPEKSVYSHPVESGQYALLGGGEGRDAIRRPSEMRGAGSRQHTATLERPR